MRKIIQNLQKKNIYLDKLELTKMTNLAKISELKLVDNIEENK